MAQGAVAVASAAASPGVALTTDELRSLLEYEKIVQFRDAVLAGTHPRIKIPPHLVGKQANAARNFSSPTTPTSFANANTNTAQPQPQLSHPSPIPPSEMPSQIKLSNNQRAATANAQAPKLARSAINPIFLQKSDDLIKAEMNLQRVRLERALREQIEQQRVTAKALLQTSESLPNFDISEVLAKAQALVAPCSAQNELAISGDAPDSDSFDENTFYSSQHDSSEWSNSSQGQKESGEMQSQDLVSVDQRPGETSSTKKHVKGQEKGMPSLSLNNQLAPNTQRQFQALHAEQRVQSSGTATSELSTSRGAAPGDTSASSSEQELDNSAQQDVSMGVSTTESRGNVDQVNVQKPTDQTFRPAFEQDRSPPVVRAHSLSPYAPQPARVSPLATAREPPILREHVLADEAPPAQVAALRTQPGISSTDSSPKGTKSSEKRKGKKKKRKAQETADTPDSPYIKPEPRSPSPFAAAPLPRPQKRQRQSGQYAAELNYDEPRYNTGVNSQEHAHEHLVGPREARTYEQVEDQYEPEFRRPAPALRRLEREGDNYRRVHSDSFARRPQSPAMYSVPYAATESRPLRAASHALVDRRIEEPRYYREPISRASVRPDADRERSRSPLRERRTPAPMGPPRQPVRIVVDEYGREYIDPTPVAPPKQSVAQPVRYREPEAVYGRAPLRAVSSRAPVEACDDDGVLYRRSSPLSAVPRRIVTRPEYAAPPPQNYRSYREREYSARPTAMAPPGEEYIQTRGDPERRETAQYEGAPRDPVPQGHIVREEPHRELASRASVRPEGRPREYATRAVSVRPEAVRYEVRDYGGRDFPARAPTVHPEAVRYEIREDGREYDVPSMSRRPEPIRYELPREYVGRLPSARVEPIPREYAGSVRPEARREIMPQSQREFSVRPADSGDRREAMPAPRVERYYEEVPRGRQAEVAFIEQPRAREASVLVYPDDVRREVYR